MSLTAAGPVIVVTSNASAFLTRLPVASKRLRVDVDRVQHWVSEGAMLSDRVSQLVKEAAKQA